MSRNPKFFEIVYDLESRLEVLKAQLPELSAEANAKINAARERCDALVEKARRQSTRLMLDANMKVNEPRQAALLDL